MSCIKFPSSKSELAKISPNNATDNSVANSQSQLVTIADQVFGKGNWSHAITSQTLDFIDTVAGSYRAGCACVVKIQLNSGNFHESLGYSCAEGSSKGSAIQKTRLNSYHDAFKKTLMCFGVNIVNKINDLPNNIKSCQNIESILNKPTPKKENPTTATIQSVKKISNPTNIAQAPDIVESTSSEVPVKKENSSVVANQIAFDPFESLPLSQTDALMDTVDMDQIISKEQNSNGVNNIHKEVKVNNLKSSSLTDKKVLEAIKSSSHDSNKKEFKLDGPTENCVQADKVDSNGKLGDKATPQKQLIYTVPTEEEARLERKRKQKEMQEEFKRKQELKRNCSVNVAAAKQQPNPSYHILWELPIQKCPKTL